MKKKLYIAYGSNINLEQMAHRCPSSRVVGTAMIPDYELQFRNVATIVPRPGAQVPVLLWEIPPRDEKILMCTRVFQDCTVKKNWNSS